MSSERGVPDPNKKINVPTWKEEYEVFLPNGARPAA